MQLSQSVARLWQFCGSFWSCWRPSPGSTRPTAQPRTRLCLVDLESRDVPSAPVLPVASHGSAKVAVRLAMPTLRASVLGSWSVRLVNGELQLAYGSGRNFPQYGALHLQDGYFRLNPGLGAGWGTSIVLPPSFWSGGQYHQGAPVKASWKVYQGNLVLTITGNNAGLSFAGQVVVTPPSGGVVTARVTMKTLNTVPLDTNRQGEAFKLVMLSSMHESPTIWDARYAYVGGFALPLPQQGWILRPPVASRVFGLVGGTSSWKTHAPSVEIRFDQPVPITGWVTSSMDPNDDNVGYWAARMYVVKTYSYSIIVRKV